MVIKSHSSSAADLTRLRLLCTGFGGAKKHNLFLARQAVRDRLLRKATGQLSAGPSS